MTTDPAAALGRTNDAFDEKGCLNVSRAEFANLQAGSREPPTLGGSAAYIAGLVAA